MEESKNTAFVRWNKDVYQNYHKLFKIDLWKIGRYTQENQYGEFLDEAISTGPGISISSNGKEITLLDNSNRVYNTDDVVMEMPIDLYAIFDNLEPWCAYRYSVSTYSSGWNWKITWRTT